MNPKQPIVKILRSGSDPFIGAYPVPGDLPEKYPAEVAEAHERALEDSFLRGSVESANDCTGITVTIPETSEEAKSLSDLRGVNITARDGAAVPSDDEA